MTSNPVRYFTARTKEVDGLSEPRKVEEIRGTLPKVYGKLLCSRKVRKWMSSSSAAERFVAECIHRHHTELLGDGQLRSPVKSIVSGNDVRDLPSPPRMTL